MWTLLTDCDVEHFKPRHPDKRMLTEEECEICRNAQLDYDNMFASCLGEELYMVDHCNHRKNNWYDFQYCVSPLSDKVGALFGFRLDGKMFSIHNNPCAEEMKKHLNLNTHILCEQRKEAYRTVVEIEFEEDELLEDDSYLSDTIAYYGKKDERGRYTPFFSMITYCMQNYL